MGGGIRERLIAREANLVPAATVLALPFGLSLPTSGLPRPLGLLLPLLRPLRRLAPPRLLLLSKRSGLIAGRPACARGRNGIVTLLLGVGLLARS